MVDEGWWSKFIMKVFVLNKDKFGASLIVDSIHRDLMFPLNSCTEIKPSSCKVVVRLLLQWAFAFGQLAY